MHKITSRRLAAPRPELQHSKSSSGLAELAQRPHGAPVGRTGNLQLLLATEAPPLERPQATFGLRAAPSIDSDLPTAGVAAVHPLLCLENTAARVIRALPGRWIWVA